MVLRSLTLLGPSLGAGARGADLGGGSCLWRSAQGWHRDPSSRGGGMGLPDGAAAPRQPQDMLWVCDQWSHGN